MKDRARLIWLLTGLILGVVGASLYLGHDRPVFAANDRFEDYVMCTGTVGFIGKKEIDGVWLLDYRSGKLLGTAVDRTSGKTLGWAEADLVQEFGIPPRQNVHFLMTTGTIAYGQAALYVAETTSGKFGVYTMSNRGDGGPGYQIRRHEMVSFRQPLAPPRAN